MIGSSAASRRPSPAVRAAMFDPGRILGPILSRTTIPDQVCQKLREVLIAGNFDPGQVLTVAQLSKTFGTSPMPVREALRWLAAEGALEIASNGSARVPAVSEDRLDDLCRARILLEGAASEFAVPQISESDIQALETIVAAQNAASKAGRFNDELWKNHEFHFTIYRAARSPILDRLIGNLWVGFGPYMRMMSKHMQPFIERGETRDFTIHHSDAIEALKRRDGGAVRDAIVADIRATQSILRKLCRGQRPLDARGGRT